MIRFIGLYSPNKAKRDIDDILRAIGASDAAVGIRECGKASRFFRKLRSLIKVMVVLKKDDVRLIQYPFKKYFSTLCRISRLKGAKTITIIHDLGTFRRRKLTEKQEIRRLNHTDYIIAHNEKMKGWLTEKGISRPVGTLNIFDYLSSANHNDMIYDDKTEFTDIAFAGGIHMRKNAFIYAADDIISPCTLNLYGPGEIDKEKEKQWKHIRYNGLIDSDVFISSITDQWGLVWDGDSIDGCSGIWGEYLRLNNPHKTSFYLRAGLPVIVWKESAMAPFVTDNGIGVTISSLRELPQVLASIDTDTYMEYKKNIYVLKNQLQEGCFFKTALQEGMDELQLSHS